MKKTIAAVLCVFMFGCATVSDDFFGAKVMSVPIKQPAGECAFVSGWQIKEATHVDTNCVCAVDVVGPDIVATRQQLSIMGFSAAMIFFIVQDRFCTEVVENMSK